MDCDWSSVLSSSGSMNVTHTHDGYTPHNASNTHLWTYLGYATWLISGISFQASPFHWHRLDGSMPTCHQYIVKNHGLVIQWVVEYLLGHLLLKRSWMHVPQPLFEPLPIHPKWFCTIVRTQRCHDPSIHRLLTGKEQADIEARVMPLSSACLHQCYRLQRMIDSRIVSTDRVSHRPFLGALTLTPWSAY